MDESSEKSILDLKTDPDFRSLLVDTLCQGIRLSSDFRDILDYVIDKKLHLFEDEAFFGSFYPEDDKTLDLIFPAIRRAWAKVFVDPPAQRQEVRIVPASFRHRRFHRISAGDNAESQEFSNRIR